MPTTDEETTTTIEDVKEEKPVSLKDSVAAAAGELDKSTEEKKVDEPKTQPKKEEEKKDEESPEELANALQLYKALKDPETSPSIIEFIAKQGGYTKQAATAETKAEVKEVAKGLVVDLKETLGPEFEFLADKIAPAIEKHLKREFEAQQADIREKLEAQEQEKLEAQSARVLAKLSTDFFGEEQLPDNVTQEMSKLMDKIKPEPDMSTKEYLELIFDAAKGRLGLTKANVKSVKEKETKTEKNRTDAASRLASDRSGSRVGVPVASPSKTGSLKSAIQAAMDSLSESPN